METPTPDASAGASRRDFLARLAAGGAAAAALAASPGCALFMSSVDPDIVLPVTNDTLVVPGSVLPWEHGEGAALVIGVEGRPDDKVLLIHSSDGELIALSTTCTHKGCDVRWNDQRGLIVCPCHGSEYDRHGGNLKGPATRPLHRYDVQSGPDGLVIKLG
ncbi:MAG TPA: ubiquinol-cytochrome c reductase iron-sulfur subunit [Planctomycetota bacterium]|nr:ubiquinol-cytochrome c reductase iron-sulfur subunit [Planctomycetota bacterium]